ncbi:MAG: DUF4349 domain-containing protein [Microbacterium sp.]
MNTSPPAGASSPLPEISAARVDEIEEAVFADIARERATQTARSARRGRIWMAGGAAAAVIAVAAIIAPAVVPLVDGTAGSTTGTAEQVAVAPAAPDAPVTDDAGGFRAADSDLALLDGSEMGGATSESSLAGPDADAGREIISSASATVIVDDVTAAARVIGNSAVAYGGYVESMTVGTSGQMVPIDPQSGVVYDSMPYPYTPDGAWITVRVPSEDLPAVVDELADVGEVTASSINRTDVTEQAVDLRARIQAAEASVDRLLQLMAEATSVADLIAAESALSERQATLESYQQQLTMLESQVAMSSLTVTLVPVVETVEADPAGFGDGFAAGWNALIATLNGIVIALGFLIPWLVVAAVAALVVWAIIRLVRRRRSAQRPSAASARHDDATSDDPVI